MRTLTIIGTGLIGTSLGLALRRAGFPGTILGHDTNPAELAEALRLGAVDRAFSDPDLPSVDLFVLCVPVLKICDWVETNRPLLHPGQLVTDVGSTKSYLAQRAAALFPPEGPRFLPGHPMAGKESGGAALAEATLFESRPWLFTPLYPDTTPLEQEWRAWVQKLGAHTEDLDSILHDKLCAWVSHMPQMVATAMSALFEDEFGADPLARNQIAAVGGRALREMTRLGASPYSMWRDVALTNPQPIAATLFALEQRLAHLRENLKTPELREEFTKANQFRSSSADPPPPGRATKLSS